MLSLSCICISSFALATSPAETVHSPFENNAPESMSVSSLRKDPTPTFSYNKLTLGFGEMDIDGLSVDGDVLFASFSAEMTERYFLEVGYSTVEFSNSTGSLDLDSLSVGVGTHTPLNHTTDLYGTISHSSLDAKISIPGFGSASGDESGLAFTVGARTMVGADLELGLKYTKVDYGSDLEGSGFTLEGLYNVGENTAVGVQLLDTDDGDTLGFGLRFYF